MIYLIRHAHAGPRALWPGADGERPLSAQGQREAHRIVALLTGRPLTRILSSPRQRCLQTVAPLAEARGLPLERDRRLDEEALLGETRTLIEAPAPGTVLCTHGPVITGLLTALAETGVALPGAHPAGRGSVWELAIEDGRIVSGRYLPPPG